MEEPSGWYISRQSGDNDGPLSDAEMRQAIARGRLKPDDFVWRDGMDGWIEARQIPNFEDVRRTVKPEPKRPLSGPQQGHQRHAPPSAQKQHLPPRKSSASGAQKSPPAQSARTVEVPMSENGQKTAPPHSLEDWLRKLGKGQPGNEITQELNDQLAKASAKLGNIPLAAVIFLILGMIVLPLLPVFWFIAWRIWTKANK